MFIDAQLKVKDEAGRLIEFHDREINVIRAFIDNNAPWELKFAKERNRRPTNRNRDHTLLLSPRTKKT